MLNAAAVIGSQFDIDSLRLLRPETESTQLAELVSAELVDQTEFVPRQRYCFRHPLVRTVAYESQLSATRVKAHGRLAAAIEARDPAAADENAALIASHLKRPANSPRLTAGTCAPRNGFVLAILPPRALNGRAPAASLTGYPTITATSSPCESRHAPC